MPQKNNAQDCLKIFLCLFMSFLGAPISRNCLFLAEIDFLFQKTRRRSSFKGFQYQIWTSAKKSENYLLIKRNLSLLCKFVTLTLDKTYVRSLRVTKPVKQIKFKGNWDELQAKYCFQGKSWLKYMRQTLVLV